MKTIQSVLADDFFSRLREENDRLQKLQTLVSSILANKAITADNCRVVFLKDNELRLSVESAAIAVRIRQILPTLRRSLNCANIAAQNITITINAS